MDSPLNASGISINSGDSFQKKAHDSRINAWLDWLMPSKSITSIPVNAESTFETGASLSNDKAAT